MSVTTDLLTGVAVKIAAEVTPAVVWSPTGVYTTSQTGIMLKFTPDKPDRVVVLTAVNQGDDISMPLGQVMIQVKGRGLPNRPTDVDDLLDSIFTVLHGTTNLVFGSVTVIQMNRKVRVPMGMDELQRWTLIDQYYLDLDSPATTNRPEQGSW